MPERILCVPTSVVNSCEFKNGVMLSKLKGLKFTKKMGLYEKTDELEKNEKLQQLVVYVSLINSVTGARAYYSRQEMDESEDRLRSNLSLGFGGHVNEHDYDFTQFGLTTVLAVAASRELREEISGFKRIVPATYVAQNLKFKYWIRDKSNEVGRVHLGAYFELDLEPEYFEELGLLFAVKSPLENLYNRFETWSQIVLRESEGIEVLGGVT